VWRLLPVLPDGQSVATLPTAERTHPATATELSTERENTLLNTKKPSRSVATATHRRADGRRAAGRYLLVAALAAGATADPTGASDFNGDGYEDLAISAPGDSVDGVHGAGVVNILYGSDGGLTATGDQLWHRDTPGILGPAHVYAGFGDELTTGDFNGDGIDDLVIAAYRDEVDGISDAGSIQTLYGGIGGLSATDNQLWSQNSPGLHGSAESDDWFGEALAAADFDGDGYDDLAIGVPREDLLSISNAGAVQVLYGSSSGLTTVNDQWWTEDSPGLSDEAEPSDSFGRDLATGDFDCNGYSDLAVLASGTGSIHVLHGSALGLWATGSGPFTTAHNVLAAGDFDGDGCTDLAVGDSHADPGGLAQAGAAHVFFGSPGAGLTTTGSQYWHQGVPGVRGRPESEDEFGSALTTCDFDGDGASDLAIGASHEDVGNIWRAGATNVLYGSFHSGLNTIGDDIWHQDSEGIRGIAEDQDHLGTALGSVGSGDFNGDGACDLAVGAAVETIDGEFGAGAVNVIYGTTNSGLTASGDQIWHQGSPGVKGVAEYLDLFGAVLSD